MSSFRTAYIRAHKGPRFGIEDARKILGVYGRPLVGTIVKPKVGLNPAQTAAVAEAAVRGGLDLVKDDETLTDQSFCPLIPRLEAVMSALDRVEKETGKTSILCCKRHRWIRPDTGKGGISSGPRGKYGHDRCTHRRLLIP